MSEQKIAMRVSRNSIVCNVVLAVFKLFAGVVAHSAAMLSDAVHTLSDVLSTIVVMIGVKVAHKRMDKGHPYGHERFECVAAIILAVMLFATGVGIGWAGVEMIMAGGSGELATPGVLALVAAVVSIVVKEGMYWYTRAAARRIDSGALMADAWHHRSDALSSVGSFVGILGARLGLPILDPIACVVICGFILKAAVSIFWDAIVKMTDQAGDEETVEKIREIVLAQAGVRGVSLLKTRLFGNKMYVEVEIMVDAMSTVRRADRVARRVHDEVEGGVAKVKHCSVRISPAG